MENGKLSAIAKPSMPMVGERKLLEAAASTSSVPINGPVHENETNTRVNAIKKMDIIPVVESTFESILFVHDRRKCDFEATHK